MRILYVDIDSLRPDHLGCYGYRRPTSPSIDALADRGVRFDNCYTSDAPCLPSRTALWSGRFGYHTGVVGHGGTAAQPLVEGPGRDFRDEFGQTGWMQALRQAGYHTVTISSFGDRHGAWHWYASYHEIYNVGKYGQDQAHEVNALALDWLRRNASRDNWFLHVNYWDPHTPYRVPDSFGDPFADQPLPPWLTEEVRQRCWQGFGPHSAQEPHGFGSEDFYLRFSRLPAQLDSYQAVRRWIDGYDTGICYADLHVGQLLNTLADLGVLEETAVVLSADHGESQGEFNVWGDHQAADEATCRVPLIVKWPGLVAEARVDSSLHYHFDWAATMIELVGGQVPANWDGRSFAPAFQRGDSQGRPYLVTSQQAWACQRGVRFDRYLCLQTAHDGFKEFEPLMLFDLHDDPHQQKDLASSLPQIVNQAIGYLAVWQQQMVSSSRHNVDPMMTVLSEGGPFHTRGRLPSYLKRLRATGRGHHADTLAARHPGEAEG